MAKKRWRRRGVERWENFVRKKRWRFLIDFLVLVFIILLIVFLINNRPGKIVDMIGVHNGYIAAFLIAFFGGLATFTFVSVYPAVIALALGGLNPILLGIIAATGLTIANVFFFYFGVKGRDAAETSRFFKRFSLGISRWFERLPEWAVPVFIWVYVGLTPFPNNILTASGGLLDIPFKKLVIPLYIGNLTLMILFAYLATLGIRVIG